MELADCLPAALQGATITKISAGLSGAGVYRCEHAGAAYVLKVTADDVPREAWEQRIAIQRAAADAGVAPRVVHVDAERRAVVSALIADRGFPVMLMTPSTRAQGIAILGQTLRTLHALPVALGAPSNPRAFLAQRWELLAGFPLPAFVSAAVRRILDEPAPPQAQANVLSHNDVNPSNLAFDGTTLYLLDWDVAGANDPLYDLASIALFLRFDDATCAALIAAHDGTEPTTLPPRFTWSRRLVATLAGTTLLSLVRERGHAGGTPTFEATLPLAEFYSRMIAGQLSLATLDGQWQFALALVKAAASS